MSTLNNREKKLIRDLLYEFLRSHEEDRRVVEDIAFDTVVTNFMIEYSDYIKDFRDDLCLGVTDSDWVMK